MKLSHILSLIFHVLALFGFLFAAIALLILGSVAFC